MKNKEKIITQIFLLRILCTKFKMRLFLHRIFFLLISIVHFSLKGGSLLILSYLIFMLFLCCKFHSRAIRALENSCLHSNLVHTFILVYFRYSLNILCQFSFLFTLAYITQSKQEEAIFPILLAQFSLLLLNLSLSLSQHLFQLLFAFAYSFEVLVYQHSFSYL